MTMNANTLLRHSTRPFTMLRSPLRSMKKMARNSVAYGRFLKDFTHFRKLARRGANDENNGNNGKNDSLPVRWNDRYPCLADRTSKTGFDRHYTYHTAWAARVLAETKPVLHTDISSSLYFVGIASAFVPMRFFDFRPAPLHLSNLTSERADVTQLEWPDESVASLSCMHVVEHIGLGRYGDPLDPGGDRKAMRELSRVISPGGMLLFVVPVGKPRVCYNAHRVYSYEQIIAAFPEMELRQFALVPDRPDVGGLILDAVPSLVTEQVYGCGCFWFQKRS